MRTVPVQERGSQTKSDNGEPQSSLCAVRPKMFSKFDTANYALVSFIGETLVVSQFCNKGMSDIDSIDSAIEHCVCTLGRCGDRSEDTARRKKIHELVELVESAECEAFGSDEEGNNLASSSSLHFLLKTLYIEFRFLYLLIPRSILISKVAGPDNKTDFGTGTYGTCDTIPVTVPDPLLKPAVMEQQTKWRHNVILSLDAKIRNITYKHALAVPAIFQFCMSSCIWIGQAAHKLFVNKPKSYGPVYFYSLFFRS
eukprot:g6017.t1